MSSQKEEHGQFDSYTREPWLHLTPASHLLSKSTPVLTQCEALSLSWSSVHTCPSLRDTHCDGGEKKETVEHHENEAKRKTQKQEIDGNFLWRNWGGEMATPEHTQQRRGVEVTLMHGVTLLVMPALIYASGINEVGPLRTCQPEL